MAPRKKPPLPAQSQQQIAQPPRGNANKIRKIFNKSGTGGDDPLDDENEETSQTDFAGRNYSDF